MQKKAGLHFNINSDVDILNINSPRQRVKGPWCVIARGNKRWVMVALDWDKKPSIGIRWFYGNSGTPISSSYATWLIIPEELQTTIVIGVNLPIHRQEAVQRYLRSEITGEELCKIFNN